MKELARKLISRRNSQVKRPRQQNNLYEEGQGSRCGVVGAMSKCRGEKDIQGPWAIVRHECYAKQDKKQMRAESRKVILS